MQKKINVLLIHSSLKHLNRVTAAEHVEIGYSEEETTQPQIINVTDEIREAPTIETYSLSKEKKVTPNDIWSDDISIKLEKDYKNKINFRYFLDGIQQTCWIKNIPILKSGEKVPYHAGQVGAVVIERSKRKLIVIKELSRVEFNILIPFSFIRDITDIQDIKNFMEKDINNLCGFTLQDTSFNPAPKTKNGSIIYSKEGKEIHDRISNRELKKNFSDINYFRKLHMKWNVRNRALLEKNIYDNFAYYIEKINKKTDSNYFIILDGTLTDVRGDILLNSIGIIKSHRQRFLDSKKHNKILQLKSFCRSPVFLVGPFDESSIEESLDRKNFRKVSKRISWYLRIRKMEHFIPTWGLLRIEMYPKLLPHKGSADLWDENDSLFINSISQKIIDERFPTSHPDKRWANLLYPIYKCEQYLKSIVVPRSVIKYIASTPIY